MGIESREHGEQPSINSFDILAQRGIDMSGVSGIPYSWEGKNSRSRALLRDTGFEVNTPFGHYVLLLGVEIQYEMALSQMARRAQRSSKADQVAEILKTRKFLTTLREVKKAIGVEIFGDDETEQAREVKSKINIQRRSTGKSPDNLRVFGAELRSKYPHSVTPRKTST